MSFIDEALKKPVLNQWRLYWMIVIPISMIMLLGMLRIEQWDGPAVSSMIQLSVRWAVPWLLLAFAASSLNLLLPGNLSRWLLRNRKIVGLCFATAMAWQGTFILWLVMGYRDYYVTEVYVLRDAIEGVLGYAFLIAMTITSFKFGRQKISPGSWRWLHKSGIYFLWAYAYSTYWWELYYYPDPDPMDYVYHWLAFAAFAVRPAAWRKKRLKKLERAGQRLSLPLSSGLAGYALLLSGLMMALLTPMWRQISEDLLTGYTMTALPERFLPFWPFEPFIPLFLIALGFFITSKVRPVP